MDQEIKKPKKLFSFKRKDLNSSDIKNKEESFIGEIQSIPLNNSTSLTKTFISPISKRRKHSSGDIDNITVIDRKNNSPLNNVYKSSTTSTPKIETSLKIDEKLSYTNYEKELLKTKEIIDIDKELEDDIDDEFFLNIPEDEQLDELDDSAFPPVNLSQDSDPHVNSNDKLIQVDKNDFEILNSIAEIVASTSVQNLMLAFGNNFDKIQKLLQNRINNKRLNDIQYSSLQQNPTSINTSSSSNLKLSNNIKKQINSPINEDNFICDSFNNISYQNKVQNSSIHSINKEDSIGKCNDIDKVAYLSLDYNCEITPTFNSKTPLKKTQYSSNFIGDYKDDGLRPELSSFEYSHSERMSYAFRYIFGLHEYRKNQLQAINSIMLNNDSFVLMPTGGGKSLCYQLPSVISPGVTFVVSPLRSLIFDQTQKLNSLDIRAVHLCGDISTAEENRIICELHSANSKIKIVYITPEKIVASKRLLDCFNNLYQRNLLSRFIIDEAHCVSQWGHDFRPDYKRLSILRHKFPKVPLMALTATATPRVRKDIEHQLALRNPNWFIQSFNRPNLKYKVIPKKPKSVTTEIINLLTAEFKSQSGIIYCLSRKECDQLAGELKRNGFLSEPYHAGLSDVERTTIQQKWINDDQCKIVCATIAFGMGIDKPDVRFVIHQTLPKSVEGYYQESGRAGRDDIFSTCVLFYNYSDVARIRRMIESEQNASFESKALHRDNLYRMVQYCENITDCRRSQILEYFGERFDKNLCESIKEAACDNCSSNSIFVCRDVSDDVKVIINSISRLPQGINLTLLQCIDIFRGAKIQKALEQKENLMYGRGSDYNRNDCERLFHNLVSKAILAEDINVTNKDHIVMYVRIGLRASQVLNGQLKIELQLRESGKSASNSKKIGIESSNPLNKLQTDCFNELISIAKDLARKLSRSSFHHIFPGSTLRMMSTKFPTSKEEMMNIDQVTELRFTQYGNEFLEITKKYSVLAKQLNDELIIKKNNDDESQYFNDGQEMSNFKSKSSKNYTGNKNYTNFKKKFSRRRNNFKKKDNNTIGKIPKKNQQNIQNTLLKRPKLLSLTGRSFLQQ